MEVCLTYKGKNGNTRTPILERPLAHTHTLVHLYSHIHAQTYTVLIILDNRRKKRKKRTFNAEKTIVRE